jgi:hypothetical protein
VPLLVYDDVRHRWNAGGSLDEGSRLVKDPVIRKAVCHFRFRGLRSVGVRDFSSGIRAVL